MIGMAKPFVGQEEIDAVVNVMKSGMLASGAVVTEFEQAFSDYIGTAAGVASCNGTTALHIALSALDIGEGDKVLTTPFTFIASSNSILFNRATPVFIDIDEDTYLMDPVKLEAYLETHYTPEMKALLVVHLFGLACDMEAIMAIAKRYNLAVIEDCAQSHGALINGKKAGSFGDAACFSFYPTKNMTTGEGGMTLFNDASKADLGRKIANHGRVDQYRHDVLGFNYRMTNIAAAIGLQQLKRLDGFNDLRIRNAGIYAEELSGVAEIQLPFVPEGYKHVFHQFTIALKNIDRTAFQAFLKEHGIGSAVVYPFSMHDQPVYKDRCEYDSLEVASSKAKVVLSLPVHPGLTEQEVLTVCERVKEFCVQQKEARS
ncbi:DegT/DnrJ/EryC1/StrS family aminotransferase [Paraferrimonas sedimenticola]|uniref:Aminotransferase DegT n=1 Tax=Paraferrimonas sedimenticola TaxID=375674 RepID=A0AA37RY12_9GAMM|nr:DegT/DnrJ/EryC1/StrS aminotransferase family protein [Paraferrimonas sedimenticola]GLP96742.1 aminotransferase DegT [Paraferrimonas sedimenticola]